MFLTRSRDIKRNPPLGLDFIGCLDATAASPGNQLLATMMWGGLDATPKTVPDVRSATEIERQLPWPQLDHSTNASPASQPSQPDSPTPPPILLTMTTPAREAARDASLEANLRYNSICPFHTLSASKTNWFCSKYRAQKYGSRASSKAAANRFADQIVITGEPRAPAAEELTLTLKP